MSGGMDTSAFKAELERLRQNITASLPEAALAGAQVLQDAIVTNIIAMDIVDTGEYRDSWSTDLVSADADQAEAETVSSAAHGPFQEYGTSKMGARPAMRTAVDSPDVQARIEAAEVAVINRVLGG